MINILPENDIIEHIESSICDCNPRVKFEDGEMIIIHNSYDGREWRENLSKEQKMFLETTSCDLNTTISENTQLFIYGYNKGELSMDDLTAMLVQAETEEEYEVAVSLRDSIFFIRNQTKFSKMKEKTFEELIIEKFSEDGVIKMSFSRNEMIEMMQQVREATNEEWSQAFLGVTLPAEVVKIIGQIVTNTDRIKITE